MTPIKPGYKTTEFWLTVISDIVLILNFVVNQGTIVHDPRALAVFSFAIVVLNAAYGLGRSLVKAPGDTVVSG